MDTSPSSLKGDGDAIISSGKGEGMVTSPFYLKECMAAYSTSLWGNGNGYLSILSEEEW